MEVEDMDKPLHYPFVAIIEVNSKGVGIFQDFFSYHYHSLVAQCNSYDAKLHSPVVTPSF